MLDPKFLRNEMDTVVAGLKRRGFEFDVANWEALEAERKKIQTQTQDLQAKRNAASKQIGKAKSKGEDVSAIMAQVASLGDELKQAESELDRLQQELADIALGLPNLPHDSVPDGLNEEANVEVRRWGEPKVWISTSC